MNKFLSTTVYVPIDYYADGSTERGQIEIIPSRFDILEEAVVLHI